MHANDDLDADIGRCSLEKKEIQRISTYPYALSHDLLSTARLFRSSVNEN